MNDPAQQPGTPRSSVGLSEADLEGYAAGTLSPERLRAVELWLATEGPEADALEGLQGAEPRQLRQRVSAINKNLAEQVKRRKKKRGRKLGNNQLAMLAIALILLLCIVAFAYMLQLQSAAEGGR